MPGESIQSGYVYLGNKIQYKEPFLPSYDPYWKESTEESKLLQNTIQTKKDYKIISQPSYVLTQSSMPLPPPSSSTLPPLNNSSATVPQMIEGKGNTGGSVGMTVSKDTVVWIPLEDAKKSLKIHRIPKNIPSMRKKHFTQSYNSINDNYNLYPLSPSTANPSFSSSSFSSSPHSSRLHHTLLGPFCSENDLSMSLQASSNPPTLRFWHRSFEAPGSNVVYYDSHYMLPGGIKLKKKTIETSALRKPRRLGEW